MVKVNNLGIKYGETVIFKNLSFTLNSGEILGIVGKNGSGKSTLALALSGVLCENSSADISGEIYYGFKNVKDLSQAEKCEEVGIIFQNANSRLYSSMVSNEIVFALENLCVKRDNIKNRLLDVCKQLDIEHLTDKNTNSLSGGEKSLAMIASVFAFSPNLIIADEITTNLDLESKKRVRKMLKQYAENGGSVLLITHNAEDLTICTRNIIIEKGKDFGGKYEN